MHRDGIFIHHALNTGEKQVGPYFVDGSAVIGAIFLSEFHRRFYHGCP